MLLPTDTLPKLIEVGLALTAPSTTPVALSGTFRVGFEPSEAIERLPVADPLDVGVNFTLKLVL